MNFLNPAFLIGLPLVTVPLIIHLLSRRQQKRIPWGAMRFLKEAATRRRRLWRLTDLLLLLLRTSVFLFFIFALARPLLSSTWLGGSVPRDVILVLDQSMSMIGKSGGTPLFEIQVREANTLLEKLTSRDSVRVLLAGESPEWLTPDAIPASPSAIQKLRTQLNSLKPTLGAANLLAAIQEAVELEAPRDKSVRMIVVMSDRQRFGWHTDERALWAAVQARLKQADIPSIVSLQFLANETDVNNLCVNRIETLRPFTAVNQELQFTAQIQNRSTAPSSATLLSWQANGQALGVTTVPELAPGASTSVSLAHSFSEAGLSEVTCRLEAKDALIPDNEARLLVQVFDLLPVLIVEEAAKSAPLEADSTFVLAALGASKARSGESTWRSVFEPTVIEPAALATTDLSPYRCVLLADPASLASVSIDKLEGYARSGGGVWIALGPRTDAAFFNEQLYRGGLGLAPLKVAAAIGDPNNRDKFFTVRAASETHPATALLADPKRLDLDRARVYRRYPFDMFSGKDVSALLEVQHDDPVVVERKFERGRVLIQTVPLGISWSTLPLCQAYVAMLHEWLWYLAEPGLPKRNLAIGDAIVEPAGAQESGKLNLPDGRVIELLPTVSNAGTEVHYGATRLPGEYLLRLENKDGEAAVTRFLVLRNPEESDLTSLNEKDLEQIRATPGFQIDAGSNALAAPKEIEIPRHPLERWLLAALAFALLGEMALASWTNQRRNLRLKPVTMVG